ncbi:MAG TPA: cation diffusion facilitator family transporter [Candidatus Aquilonibacter sp.]|nr:cation diffusion facilitator family transporter [Candidatus Aquilonibacter sp.]
MAGRTQSLAMSTEQHERAYAKRTAALTSFLAASGITLLKLITGLLTGSLGMLSESAHSGIDLIGSLLTFTSVRVSDRPADAEHTFGHGKVENLSAALETGLMVVSCAWIATEAVLRILHPARLTLRFSIWPFVVLLLSIAVDSARSIALHRVAKTHRSEALEADAVHFGTDIWSSIAVIVGLMFTYAGQRWSQPGLRYADPIAALAVAGIIFYVTWKLARKTLDSLLDATPAEVREQIYGPMMRELLAIHDVISVPRLRVRRSGSNYFVDLTLGLPRALTFQRSEQVTLAATALVQKQLPGADVVVKTVPLATMNESLFERVRAVAQRSSLNVHDVTLQQYDGALHLEQHLEVPESISLRRAHEIATQLEADIRREVPGIATLLTHIEGEPATIAHAVPVETAANLERQLRKTAESFPEILDIHEITVTRGHAGAANALQVNCHCTLPDDLPMSRVHAIITDFENEFRLHHPQVPRVLIHPEPASDNRR